MLNKSIQDGKVNLPKPNANQPHVRKASMGIISPTQNSSSLFNDNKLIFSGSQLTTVKVDKAGGGGKPPTVKDKLNTTQPIKQQVTKLHIQKQPSSSHKKQKMPTRIQPPATGESLEIGQFQSEPQQMLTTQQLSGLFQQINSNKQVMIQQQLKQHPAAGGLASFNPASIITSPNNVNHNAIISQFSSGPMSIVQSPAQQQNHHHQNSNAPLSTKQTPQSIKQQMQDFQNMQLNQAMLLNNHNQITASQFNSQGAQQHVASKQRNHTGAKSAFNTTQPISSKLTHQHQQ